MANRDDKNDKPGNAILLNGAVGGVRPLVECGRRGGDFRSANREIGGPGGAGWHSRGYPPHFDVAGVTQHVTNLSFEHSGMACMGAARRRFPRNKRENAGSPQRRPLRYFKSSV